jgi:hypothetical protein
MPHATTNVNNTTKVIYTANSTYGVELESMSISNKTAGDIDITIMKYSTTNATDYTILSTTTLTEGRTFYKTGGYLNLNWSIKVRVSGGNADVDLNYKIIYEI